MSKSRNKSRSEVEFLRGENRRLKAELKYYKRREHLVEPSIDNLIDDQEVESVDAKRCQHCRSGILVIYDFIYATLKRCTDCGYEERQRKRGKET